MLSFLATILGGSNLRRKLQKENTKMHGVFLLNHIISSLHRIFESSPTLELIQTACKTLSFHMRLTMLCWFSIGIMTMARHIYCGNGDCVVMHAFYRDAVVISIRYLAKILAPEGSKDVLVGQPIAITVENPDEIKSVPSHISSGVEAKEEKSTETTEHKENTQKTTISRISPSAKLLITEYGLDVSSLKASGPLGTLLKGDVLAAIKTGGLSLPASKPSPDKASASANTKQPSAQTTRQSDHSPRTVGTHDDLPNSQIRKVIAKRLLESKQSTPHFYLSSDVILDPLLAFRNELKEKHKVKVSVNDIIIKAVALALRSVPEVNAYWNDEKGEPSLRNSIDISIAVATEKGLMTPIVRNADQKTLSAISLEVKELAEKARAGKLAPDQFQGGTFSISNLGMYPVDNFCAIINPPQACILAVGRGNKVVEPVVSSDGTLKPAAVTKMCLNLSADNRVFDVEVGGKFLSALSLNISDLRRLLL